MTERVLPAIALPRPRVADDGAGLDRPRPGTLQWSPEGVRPATAVRRDAILTTPARVGMLLGASAAMYAVTLAGVSFLQSSADADIAARRQPWLDEIAAARAANDATESALMTADQQSRWLSGVYADVGNDVTAYQARLDELSALVAKVQGSAAALPSRISLPAVVTRGAISTRSGGGTSKAPATTTKTAASGG